jgi:hypothetical protein
VCGAGGRVVEGAETCGVLAPGVGGYHGACGVGGADAVAGVDSATEGEVGEGLPAFERTWKILPPGLLVS